MPAYRKVEDLNRAYGTHLIGSLNSSYSKLKGLLGEPNEGDEYKVTMQWVVEDEQGRVFTIYDWKMSNLFDDNEGGGFTPDELKELPELQFHIGGQGKEGLEELYAYLEANKVGKRSSSCLASVTLAVMAGTLALFSSI